MSGNPHAKPLELVSARQYDSDLRTRRTKQRLGSALMTLISEKPIDDITVREVLERAGVGRSTFYLHFRDKNDLLLCQLEQFLETMSTILIVRKDTSRRVLPVAEMFDHVGGQNKLWRALSDAGRLHDFFDIAELYFARAIEQRLAGATRLHNVPKSELPARACAFAGSLISLLRWWIARGAKESPASIDDLFHRMVWSGMK
ncbi:MAG TPA: TetR/AcrR family transcriptional regulator [Candidatus Koribacter sp.]|jgi:AcrR family transcriptional regulator